MSNGSNEFVWGALILSLMITLAIIITPIMLVGIPAYIFYRLYSESPKRLERLAREETQILYNHALAGSVHLSYAEVETALAQHWPPDTPTALRIQLIEIGKALFAQEGLMPDIPPLPALCNTVEGARYCERQIRLRADKAEVARVLGYFTNSAKAYPTLMDLA